CSLFICSRNLLYLFCFFQAEDGIRDRYVTGVQTCALPILPWDNFSVPCDKSLDPSANCCEPSCNCDDPSDNSLIPFVNCSDPEAKSLAPCFAFISFSVNVCI